uniref:Activin_recp domain-containing protein n=1 Tax=Panagrellus redivivus TaxID=6233 RepID=A0A7E4UXD5_PANRE
MGIVIKDDDSHRPIKCREMAIPSTVAQKWTTTMTKFALIYVLLINLITSPLAMAGQCYSCAGTCHREPCNCQMGSCEADYCFIERKPDEIPGSWRITKGCLKRPSRTRSGCDFDNSSNHIQCVCAGDFCNEAIYMYTQIRRNVTCKMCPERDPECSDTCQGQWCHEDAVTGATGCGYGPPSLPFFYKGPELLYHRNKLCVTLSRGNNAKPWKYCICNTHLCNDPTQRIHYAHDHGGNVRAAVDSDGSVTRSRSVSHNRIADRLPLHKCVSCDTTSQADTMTSACKQNHCHGHFCTLATKRFVKAGNTAMRYGLQSIIHEQQGCINVTDTHKIQLGCSHKWMNNEEEELFCACSGALCNSDLGSASRSTASRLLPNVFQTVFSILSFRVLLNFAF